MAPRWSNPSGSVGVHRFRVWPAGTDSYDHAELTSNFDTLDGILGIPAGGAAWPPTTGVDGGIYKLISDVQTTLSSGELPVGATFCWFRPSDAVALPTGFNVCDGSVVTKPNHDFTAVPGSITLPDMRHAMPLGADPNKSVGTGASAVGGANINGAAGAPGPGATGGENQHTQTIAEMANHTHSLTPSIPNQYASAFPSGNIPNYGSNAVSPPTIGYTGGGGPHENRPKWVGLIWITKVKN